MSAFIDFFRSRPALRAFVIFTAFYSVCLATIFWGTWSCSVAAIQPDAGVSFAPDAWSRAWTDLFTGRGLFLPTDVVNLIVSPWALQEFKYALAVYCAALGVAYYLRGRGLGWIPAYGAGAAYGLMGYTFTLFSAGHYGWFSWLTYGPFAFGLTDRAVRHGAWRLWVLLGSVLAWGSVRQPDMWLLFAVLTFVYGVWCLVRERKGLTFRHVAIGLVLTALTAGAIGAPSFWGAFADTLSVRDRQIAESTAARTSGDPSAKDEAAAAERWRFCTSWSLPPEDIAEFVWPRIHGDTCDVNIIALRQRQGWRTTTTYTGRIGMPVPGPDGKPVRWMPYRQHSLYFGFLTVLLALAALVGIRRTETNRGEIIFWTGAAVLLTFCALGCFTPFYRLVYVLPFGSYLRAPVKFVHLVEFAVAVLAGFGAAAIARRWNGSKATVVCLLALFAVNAIDLARIDALYLGPLDLSFQRASNAAAEDVWTAGGGRVAVLVPPQQGGQLMGESFTVHGVAQADAAAVQAALQKTDDADGLQRSGARFIFTTADAFAKNGVLNAAYRNGRLQVAGTYALAARTGIVRTEPARAQAVLLSVSGVAALPPDPPSAPPLPRRLLNGFSSLVTLALVVLVRRK